MISHRTSRQSGRGFTLVELVTTVVILGILSAVALPRLFDNQAFSERGYVDEVAAAIRYAQKIAVASECEVSIVIGAGAYAASQHDTFNNCNNAAAPWTTQVLRAGGSDLTGTAPAGVAMAPAATLIFDLNGRVSNGNPPIFTVGIFTLIVDPVSGLVTVLP